MGLTNFDELNTFSTTETTKDDRHKATRKKIPIHDYFENMQISEEEKEKRVRLANALLADVLFLFALSKRNQDKQYLSEAFQKRYLSSVKKVAEPDQKMQRYIRKVCDSIVDTTLKGGSLTTSKANKPQDPYVVSVDRATNVAENESNAILNGDEYNTAVKNGCTKKRWKSYRDERVRADHADADGQVVDINRPFRVGKYMMMYPKDESLGAGLEEIVNCRCSVEYLQDRDGANEAEKCLDKTEKSVGGFEDITEKYIVLTQYMQGTIEELQEYDYDGMIYKVDNVNVKQRHDDREMQIAHILCKKLGFDVKIVPEINGQYQKISTPDYLVDGERWDLKQLKNGTSKELLRNIVHKKKKQAENFIFDITESALEKGEINRQAEAIFNQYYNTKHVKKIIIIEKEDIIRFLSKK